MFQQVCRTKKRPKRPLFCYILIDTGFKKSAPVTLGTAPRERKNIDRIYLRRNASGHPPIIPDVDDIPLTETQCAGRIDNYPLPRCEIKCEQTVALPAGSSSPPRSASGRRPHGKRFHLSGLSRTFCSETLCSSL